MLSVLKSVLKVIVLRFKCAKSIRKVKHSIQNHVGQVEAMTEYFKNVTVSYHSIISTLEAASKTFEAAEKDLLVIYHQKWNTAVKGKLSDQILLIQDNRKYLLGLKDEMSVVSAMAEKF